VEPSVHSGEPPDPPASPEPPAPPEESDEPPDDVVVPGPSTVVVQPASKPAIATANNLVMFNSSSRVEMRVRRN
jgi:hypothetical protein